MPVCDVAKVEIAIQRCTAGGCQVSTHVSWDISAPVKITLIQHCFRASFGCSKSNSCFDDAYGAVAPCHDQVAQSHHYPLCSMQVSYNRVGQTSSFANSNLPYFTSVQDLFRFSRSLIYYLVEESWASKPNSYDCFRVGARPSIRLAPQSTERAE